ncbi:unnamed protein product [Gongylonema pulchrum]|uniref:Uncharacterized protein n=1 Tax=Gongylonema pulchrum TaxID=637853 RepID=A0A183DFK7_9BILA|nr:unnamed protein product [Gongylonema pulchrum]
MVFELTEKFNSLKSDTSGVDIKIYWIGLNEDLRQFDVPEKKSAVKPAPAKGTTLPYRPKPSFNPALVASSAAAAAASLLQQQPYSSLLNTLDVSS